MFRNKFNLRNVVAIAIFLADFSISNVLAQTSTTDEGVVFNGITWATRNVGAPGTFVDKQSDNGMFYQWNSKVGWNATGSAVSTDGSSWNSAWDGNGASTWERDNDPCPTGWRVPTANELELLRQNSQWGSMNNTFGRANNDGHGVLFLPVTGGRSNTSSNVVASTTTGGYWSSTPVSGSNNIRYFWFDSNYAYSPSTTSISRAYGFCIRCVKDNTVGINEISEDSDNATIIGYFDIMGRKLQEEPAKGLYIVQYDNGKTKKIMKQ